MRLTLIMMLPDVTRTNLWICAMVDVWCDLDEEKEGEMARMIHDCLLSCGKNKDAKKSAAVTGAGTGLQEMYDITPWGFGLGRKQVTMYKSYVMSPCFIGEIARGCGEWQPLRARGEEERKQHRRWRYMVMQRTEEEAKPSTDKR